jgi:hypothetical protein
MAVQKKNNSLNEIIGLINTGKKYPAVNLIGKDPEIAAVVSKLIEPRVRDKFITNNSNADNVIARGSLGEISKSIEESTNDANNMMQLFPDMELSAQILISSIISPKDMMSSEIIYRARESFLSTEITTMLLDVIKSNCDVHYDFKALLPELLRDVLFETGSYPIAIIPESSLDELINGSSTVTKESLSEIVDSKDRTVPLGILGSSVKAEHTSTGTLSLESFGRSIKKPISDDEVIIFRKDEDSPGMKLVTVTDNFNLLKLPLIVKANNERKIRSAIRAKHLTLESSVDKLEATFYKNKNQTTKQFVSVKTLSESKRKSIGRPLFLKLPSEAIIPVHVPGNEKEHIGYFVLVDDEGNPVSKNSNSITTSNDMTTGLGANTSMSSFLTEKTKRNVIGDNRKDEAMAYASKIYSDIVENDLLARLKNGVYGSKLELGSTDEVYRIMLARTLSNQYTKLLFVPKELVVYFAYKYNKNGVGKSLLEDMRILNSLRAMTMFARVMASLKNSIGTTEVKLKLDENDPNPEKTVEDAVHEIMRTRQQNFPIGLNAASDIADWVQRSGFEFSFEGHPGLPDVSFEFNQKQQANAMPDTDLDEELKKRAIMAIGLSPETVDNGFAAEFATTVVANNILLSKRVLQIQEKITPQLTQLAVKLVTNDRVIYDELVVVIKENKDNIMKYLPDEIKTQVAESEDSLYSLVIESLCEELVLELPKPSSTTLANQMEGFDHYVESLDKCIDSWLGAEMLSSDFAGDISNNADNIKAVIRAGFIRKYLAENNILPELNDIIATDEDGSPKINIFDMQKDLIEGVIRTSVKFIKGTETMRNAANKDLANMGSDGGDDGGSEPESTPEEAPVDGGDDTGGDDTGGDGTGTGDDGLGDMPDV